MHHMTNEKIIKIDNNVCTECGAVLESDTPDFIWGDANGDGIVNIKDAVLLSQYLAAYDYGTGTSTVSVSQGADANGDGALNIKDAVLLSQYLAAYDYGTGSSSVVLGPKN